MGQPYLLLHLARYTSFTWKQLLDNFIMSVQQLEQLGFTYFKGQVIIIDNKY